MKIAIKITLLVTFILNGLLSTDVLGNPTGQRQKLLSGAGKSIKPLDNGTLDDSETQQLDSIFVAGSKNASAFPPGHKNDLQKHEIENDMQTQLETFVTSHPNSTWTPGVHMFMARRTLLRSGYVSAMDHYWQAWTAIKGATNASSKFMGIEASGALAKLLVLTGHEDKMDALYAEVEHLYKGEVGGPAWDWALEMRRWTKKSPTESHKCGLYCLDQLGRLTESPRYVPKNVLETVSSTNGFTAAELVQVGTKAGLHIHAALLTNFTDLPTPMVVHLRSDHFVVVREKHGDFYDVFDPVAYGRRWLTSVDIAQEASGCVIVSDAKAPKFLALTPIDLTTAAAYRGRCHNPLPGDGSDGGGCTNTPPPDGCSTCPPGPSPGPGPSHGPGPGPGPSHGPGVGPGPSPGVGPGPSPSPGVGPGPCSSCKAQAAGMPSYTVSEPYLTPWVIDVPLEYTPAYGPEVRLKIAYNSRNQPSTISYYYNQGAGLGNSDGYFGMWNCSWFSYAELDPYGGNVQLLMPGGGWIYYIFADGSNISSVDFLHNTWLEKVVDPVTGNITSLVAHYSNGSQRVYAVWNTSLEPYCDIYFMSSEADAAGNQTTFAYDANYNLSTVTAADGTYFTLSYTNTDSYSYTNQVTSVTSSYGATVNFSYDVYEQTLVGITDAAGISSTFGYIYSYGDAITSITTPYGTTAFNLYSGDPWGDTYGPFERAIQITKPDNSIEFYGLINSYSGTDWPDFATSQIPTNTPTGTLDADPGNRQERNTIYWNSQQFAPFVNTSLYDFNWSIFMQGRIRHWLGGVDLGTYTHFIALSVEQAPSPDGTTEGQLTWYDYTNKPAGMDYEIGSQVMASDIAKVLPDGTTWYMHTDYTTNGLPLDMIEKWVDNGADHFRNITFVYAANGIDLVAMTNALGTQEFSNVYNGFHQVVTNYDALNQMSTATYDSATLQLTSETKTSGLVTTNIYYPNHRLKQTIDLQINRTNGYGWNADGTIFCHTNELGLVVTNFWDGLHRPTGTLYPDGTTTSNLYYLVNSTPYPNSTGDTNILDLTASKDRMGYWTSYVYDPLRRLIATTNANQVVTAYGYCDCGALTYITNGLGTPVQAVTQYVYDNQSQLILTILPDNSVVTNTLDSLERIAVIGDAYGQRTNTYDNLGRLTAVSNYFGPVILTAYDAEDHQTNIMYTNGVSINVSWDNLDRITSRSYPDGGIEKYGYSARGMTVYSNQLGFANHYGYDAGSRMTSETNANQEVIQYTYDPAGHMLTLTDGKTNTTTWHFNIYGFVSNKVDAASNVVLVYRYDADNRLTNRWTPAKADTYYSYDAAGNLTNITYPVSPAITFSYDALNRATQMVDSLGTNSYSYDAVGQKVSEGGLWPNDTVSYGYYAGLRTNMSLQQPNTNLWVQTYGYDGARRLTNTVSPAGSFTYQYDPVAKMQVSLLTLPNGAYITNTYDNVGRQLSTKLKNSGGVNLDAYTYGYNQGDERTNVIRTAGDYINYGYDRIGQLTNAIGKEASGTNRLQEQFWYGYDVANNLTTRTNNALVQHFGVNSLNELTNITRNTTNALTVTGSAAPHGSGVSIANVTVNGLTAYHYGDNTFAKDGFTLVDGSNTYTATATDSLGYSGTQSVTAYLPASPSYTYDANGNLLSDGTRYFAYDDENQLISVWVTNAWQSQFAYDGERRRRITREFTWSAAITNWLQTNETRFIYSDDDLVIQERGTNNLPQISYTRGKDISGLMPSVGGIGGLLALSQGPVNPQPYYYHCDVNGNITALINSNQVSVASYLYDPYGNVLSMNGPMAKVNVYQFSSKEYHQNSALVYYLYRFYDPALQRWINCDPIQESGGINLYAFVLNEPVNAVDPFGLKPPGPGDPPAQPPPQTPPTPPTAPVRPRRLPPQEKQPPSVVIPPTPVYTFPSGCQISLGGGEVGCKPTVCLVVSMPLNKVLHPSKWFK